MKKTIKNILRYITMFLIPIVLAIAFTLLYGFFIGGEYYIWIRFALWGVVIITWMTLYQKSSNKNNTGEAAAIVVFTAMCIIIFSGTFYDRINESSATLQDTYETEIIAIEHRRSRSGFEPRHTIWRFNSPDGEERYIKLDGERGDEMLYEQITVEEYLGLFDKTFCVRKD